ncbi:MAG TPA: hypothetical protein PKW97_14365 [Syntrophorhabdus sp.]|nr:hypothetical protein [Syntrophorhabdus sp.]
MRLSEKTLELSLCAQFAAQWNLRNAIWFGLTQTQEKKLGFDACSRISGRLLILQFKASNLMVQPQRFQVPRRRFTVPHDQLVNLCNLATGLPRAVYYVFPDLGTTRELSRNQDLVQQTWFLDLSALPQSSSISVPRNRARRHYAYTDPPLCELRSKPLHFDLLGEQEISKLLEAMHPNSLTFVKWCHEHENEFAFKGFRAYGLLLP